MSEIPEPENSQTDKGGEEKSPFSPNLSELCAALDRLYVRANLSGRLNFRVRWPYAAPYVFGGELLAYDADGTPDREARAKLEEQSDARRLELLAALETIREESLDGGVIKMGYVAEVLERYDRDFLGYIYSEEVVEALNPSNPGAPPKEWSPHLSGAKLVEIPREGMTYQELLQAALKDAKGTLSLAFNERAYLRPRA